LGFSSIYYAQAVRVRSGAERATLVRRTYGLVFLGVLVTMLGSAFAFTQESVMIAAAKHPIITFLVALAPLFMAQRYAREFPKNVILTLIFTLIMGIAIAPVLLVTEARAPGAVLSAGVLTLVAFGGLSLYALVSRRDFSAWGSFFMIGLLVLIVASLINMFVQSAAAGVWISMVTVLIFSGLLVFDTWRIVRSGQFGQDDYVIAAVQIYLDLLNMFMAILSLVGGRDRR
jgi:FtsH-binding integral membrane protein